MNAATPPFDMIAGERPSLSGQGRRDRPPPRRPRREAPEREPREPRRSERPRDRRPRRRGSILGLLIKLVMLAAIWGGLVLAAVLAYYAADLPDVSQAVQAHRRPSITLTAADGSTIARYGDMQGTTLDSADLPPHLIEAVMAVEDRRFKSHFGVDPIGLLRAAYTNFRNGRVAQGGSTITQQLAKNLFLSTERTFKRKIQEAMLALWLERQYTKRQILTAYLNRVYLGAGTFGVDAAARTYFNKPATEVNLHEAAILAGLLKAPSRYSPANSPDEANQRAQVVLSTMVDAGFISVAEAAAARSAPAPRVKPGSSGDARYFAEWIADQIDDFVGYDYEDLVVQTTLDPTMQRAAEARMEATLAGPGAQANAGQGAVVALAPDGAVRALVGGRSYADSQFNRATQALRQPGSSFKPFVYLAALEVGLTPESLVDDAPIRIGTWQPANFEKEFRGMIPLREALAHSVNTSAVRVLEKGGIDRVRGLARRLGITSPMRRDLSLALGTSEVTLIELTGAYAALANGGTPVFPYAITEIRDRNGRVLYQRRGSGGGGAAVAAGNVADLVRMMRGVVDGGTGKAARLDRPVAGKTGTTQDHRDAWFVGFTGDLVAGVWLGNDNNAEMKRVTGGGLPAKLWHDFMVDAHVGRPVRPLQAIDPAAPARPGVTGPGVTGPLVDASTGTARASPDSIQGLIQSLTKDSSSGAPGRN